MSVSHVPSYPFALRILVTYMTSRPMYPCALVSLVPYITPRTLYVLHKRCTLYVIHVLRVVLIWCNGI